MKVAYTEPALADLNEITAWLKQNYPGLGRAVERRLQIVVAHIARWPESMRGSARWADVRVALLGRYPYKIYYRIRHDTVEILHIHHVAREPWDERN